MVGWTILCGLVATIVVTILQVSFEYSSGIHELEETMRRIQYTMSATFSTSVWNLDESSLRTSAEGLLNHPDIKKVEISKISDVSPSGMLSVGEAPDKNFIEYQFNLVNPPGHDESPKNDPNNGGDRILGVVKITATTTNLQTSIWRQTILILITQGAKALVMALLIYFFMTMEILNPLGKLADHVKSIRPGERTPPYKLERFIADSDDEITRLNKALITMSTNATEAVYQLEKELKLKKEMQSQVVQMAHESGIAEAATGILHDVANMTNGNLLYVELLKTIAKSCDDPSMRAKLEDPVTKLEHRIHQAAKIIRAQQGMAGRAMKIDQTSVMDMINDALILEEPQNKKNAISVNRGGSEDCIVKVSRPQLVSVLVNLVKNARESILQANPSEGVISIAVSMTPKDCAIVITDNGMGATQETLAKLFVRGFTTKETGHGFGLATSHMVVKSFGGSMAITSPGPGKGASVRIELPKAEFAPEQLPLEIQSLPTSA